MNGMAMKMIMIRWQEAGRTGSCHGLLRTHHDRVGKPAQQHDEGDGNVHDADFLVVDRREPLGPQVRPFLVVGDQTEHHRPEQRNDGECHHHYRLVEGHRFQTKFTEHLLLLCPSS
jgi:hypothetical protein